MILNADTIQWLLGASTPAVRLQTLTDLLGRPADDPEAAAARAAIMTTGPVPGILEKQNPSGSWVSDSHYYSPKFRSAHWSMMLLAELGVDGGGCAFSTRRGPHTDDGAERPGAALAEGGYQLDLLLRKPAALCIPGGQTGR